KNFVSLGALRGLGVTKLSLEEQTQIATFLDRETQKIDRLIEKQQQLIKLLQEKRQAVISHAVTKGLNPDAKMKESGVEWLGKIPEHWEIKRYKHALALFQGAAFKSSEYVADSDVVNIRMGNIKKGGFIDLKHNVKYLPGEYRNSYSKYELKEGDLIVAMTDMSPSLDFLAVPAYMVGLESSKAYLLNQRVGKLIVNNSFSTGYVKYLLLSNNLRSQLKAQGLGTVQSNMSSENLYSSFFVAPSLNEQEKIVIFLDKEDVKIGVLVDKCNNAIQLLKERRTALISAAVTGKIDVRNLVNG
ncbi:MAG: restriction endonuclease subunit S, partial [Gammaproteobacteria bacterium]|nr:restriction endonuclease subunit S [Gammaproteobacteria bacterium]